MSLNFVDYVRAREISMQKMRKIPEMCFILTHNLLKERNITPRNMRPILSSQWLSDSKVIFGAKYNQLIVYDMETSQGNQMDIIRFYRRGSSTVHVKFCDIHSLKINFSRTLLCVGARNSNQIVILKLPSLDLVCVCQSSKFQVFDMFWLDDEFLVVCSVVMELELWRIDSNLVDPSDNAEGPTIKYIEPVRVIKCDFIDNLRKVTFNKTTKEIAVLTMNNLIRTWSCKPDRSFEPKSSKQLSELGDCDASLATHDDGSYAIGGSRRIFFLNTRLETIKEVPNDNGLPITSASFQGSILTMGTYMKLMFYDVRTHKYLKYIESNRIVSLNASYIFQYQASLPIIIYTHCYNPSGTKLFMGGGSLTYSCHNYAGIWQCEHLI